MARGVQHQVALGFGVEFLGLDEQAFAREVAGQERLRQRRALIGDVGLVAHKRDGAGEAVCAQACDQLDAAWPAPTMTTEFAHVVCAAKSVDALVALARWPCRPINRALRKVCAAFRRR